MKRITHGVEDNFWYWIKTVLETWSKQLRPAIHDSMSERAEGAWLRLRHLEICYGQLAVFQAKLDKPFNDWTQSHVAQGFVWRYGSVSFATLDVAGPVELNVGVGKTEVGSWADRIIAVPFEVDESGEIEVASISEGHILSLPAGRYRLVFEHGRGENGWMICRLSFEPNSADVHAAVIKFDSRDTSEIVIDMAGWPA